MTTPPSLLMVPGLGLDAAAWGPTRDHLHGLTSRVVELPGFGRRARGEDVRPDAVAAQLAARLPPGPTVLVGHSASCQVVAHAATLCGESVVGLLLVGPTTDPRAARWGPLARRWLATARHERPQQVPSLLRQYARTGPVAMTRTMDAARRDDIRAALNAGRRPVLVVRGTYDRICPADWAARVAEVGAPGSWAATLAAGAHMVPLTHGGLLAAEVRAFVATLGPE